MTASLLASAADTAVKPIPIIELFGPVIQGEGALIGQQTHFVRTGGCDYRCTWCDTLYAVLPAEVRQHAVPMTPAEIVADLRRRNPATPWVTLSGGNPVLHELGPLVAALQAAGYRAAVETQGSLYRPWLADCDLVTVSPKPPSSGMHPDLDRLARFLGLPGLNFKVVVFDEADFAFARAMHRRYPDVPCYLQVGNVVGQDSTAALLAKLDWLARCAMGDPAMADAVILPQLHVLMYGNRRGV